MLTQEQLTRLKTDWGKVTKENIVIEELAGKIDTRGSEFACLRLYHYYKGYKAKIQYSINLKSWVFSLEISAYNWDL